MAVRQAAPVIIVTFIGAVVTLAVGAIAALVAIAVVEVVNDSKNQHA